MGSYLYTATQCYHIATHAVKPPPPLLELLYFFMLSLRSAGTVPIFMSTIYGLFHASYLACAACWVLDDGCGPLNGVNASDEGSDDQASSTEKLLIPPAQHKSHGHNNKGEGKQCLVGG